MPPWGPVATKKFTECKKQRCVRIPPSIAKPWESRMEFVQSTVQELLNRDHRSGRFRREMKFAVGEAVLVMSKGLYFSGTIHCCYRVAVPATLFGPNRQLKDIPKDQWVQTYLIRFEGFGLDHDEEYPENEIIRRIGDCPANIMGMLYAHEWNTLQRMRYNCEDWEMGDGTWYLPDDTYGFLEQQWKRHNNTVRTFSQFCGRQDALHDLAAEKATFMRTMFGNDAGR
ncbi:uncharacterized protein LOC129598747 [Paramacrobiotus metropolitanus]|uniref:uncharacterized protein LOC129598747 n=1 Tax=Paramacrobiotus metropolitanus TaxID=2943436 RepID=UPI002445D948|nr:uncharacterized protein LOC129598747 [Paramacrobiotus metropolitanus]